MSAQMKRRKEVMWAVVHWGLLLPFTCRSTRRQCKADWLSQDGREECNPLAGAQFVKVIGLYNYRVTP